jgi:hypothetical protein
MPGAMPGCSGRQVPNRIYERTFKNATAGFGKQRISFGYEALFAYKLQQTGVTTAERARRRSSSSCSRAGLTMTYTINQSPSGQSRRLLRLSVPTSSFQSPTSVKCQ